MEVLKSVDFATPGSGPSLARNGKERSIKTPLQETRETPQQQWNSDADPIVLFDRIVWLYRKQQQQRELIDSFRSSACNSNQTVRTPIILFLKQKKSKILLFPTAKGLWFHQVVPLRERIQSPITTLLRHARIFGMASALFNTPTTPSGYTCVRAHQITSG